MAQRVHVVLVDDLDGSDADETVTFGLDGVDYEIDLTDAHAAALRE
ncbi:MAG: Lsr2 family protein, partial [Nocardioides sp.]